MNRITVLVLIFLLIMTCNSRKDNFIEVKSIDIRTANLEILNNVSDNLTYNYFESDTINQNLFLLFIDLEFPYNDFKTDYIIKSKIKNISFQLKTLDNNQIFEITESKYNCIQKKNEIIFIENNFFTVKNLSGHFFSKKNAIEYLNSEVKMNNPIENINNFLVLAFENNLQFNNTKYKLEVSFQFQSKIIREEKMLYFSH